VSWDGRAGHAKQQPCRRGSLTIPRGETVVPLDDPPGHDLINPKCVGQIPLRQTAVCPSRSAQVFAVRLPVASTIAQNSSSEIPGCSKRAR